MPDFEADQNLLECDILDSAAMMELLLWNKGHFGFIVDTDDLITENFATLDAIVAYIDKQLAKGS